ncbi:MAG TPA: helix-hairpin-helix domain-containing protein, partial [Candidatus Omnitrophota bacterium]|nr:helix-hairpin-helix domain-containing protein [Candidatus Omnitrophota bacterium]
PKFTPWIVVVDGAKETPKLVNYLVGYRYPLQRIRIVFAGENWDNGTDDFVQKGKSNSSIPPQLIFRGMPVREDNLNEVDIKKLPREERKKMLMAWVQANHPYTKPGANTSVLDDSDGTSGIIYDAENTPHPLQPLEFILGVMDGVATVRRLSDKFTKAYASSEIGEEDNAAVSVKKASALLEKTLPEYGRALDEKDISDSLRFNIKQKGILKRQMRYFVKHNLKTLLEITEKDPKLFSTGMLFEYIKEQVKAGRSLLEDKEMRELLNLYIVLCNMPGYGEAATEYIKGTLTKDAFVKELIKGEFRRVNEPKNGQGRLAKITNALEFAGPDKGAGSQGSVAAFMYGEYASWYDPGWSGFMASQDTFKPLGGTTGYFCTEVIEEIDWQDQDVQTKLSFTAEENDIVKQHYVTKNKLLAIGAWDEFQVAEDYMLGFVTWWYGFNIAGFMSLTPENPAGFEAEVGYKFRPKQLSRWIKGYNIGLVVLTENWSNVSELWERKGWWGFFVFLVPTLSSAVNPLLFIAARFITQLWWIFFVPVETIRTFLVNITFMDAGSYIQGMLQATQLDTLLLNFQDSVVWFITENLNYLDWSLGAPIVVLPFALHAYFTLRGIFRGVDNRLGMERILAEHDELLEDAQKADPAVVKEVEDRIKAIKEGSLEEVPGLVSPKPFILAASALIGAFVTIIAMPFIVSSGVTFLAGVGVWVAVSLIISLGVNKLTRWYVDSAVKKKANKTPEEEAAEKEEKSIRAMAVRAGSANLFIAFYHATVYLPGNTMAWSEIISGGRTGYWWRTPRVVGQIAQVKKRQDRKFALGEAKIAEFPKPQKEDKVAEDEFIEAFKEKMTKDELIERDLEHTRLWTRLIYGWGFVGAMLLLVAYNFRMNLRDQFITSIVSPFMSGSAPTTYIYQLASSNPLIALGIVAGSIAMAGLLFAVSRSRGRSAVPEASRQETLTLEPRTEEEVIPETGEVKSEAPVAPKPKVPAVGIGIEVSEEEGALLETFETLEEIQAKVNINTATLEELQTIPGVGPVLAERILEYRQTNGDFESIEDLLKVSGIGEKKLESIREYVDIPLELPAASHAVPISNKVGIPIGSIAMLFGAAILASMSAGAEMTGDALPTKGARLFASISGVEIALVAGVIALLVYGAIKLRNYSKANALKLSYKGFSVPMSIAIPLSKLVRNSEDRAAVMDMINRTAYTKIRKEPATWHFETKGEIVEQWPSRGGDDNRYGPWVEDRTWEEKVVDSYKDVEYPVFTKTAELVSNSAELGKVFAETKASLAVKRARQNEYQKMFDVSGEDESFNALGKIYAFYELFPGADFTLDNIFHIDGFSGLESRALFSKLAGQINDIEKLRAIAVLVLMRVEGINRELVETLANQVEDIEDLYVLESVLRENVSLLRSSEVPVYQGITEEVYLRTDTVDVKQHLDWIETASVPVYETRQIDDFVGYRTVNEYDFSKLEELAANTETLNRVFAETKVRLADEKGLPAEEVTAQAPLTTETTGIAEIEYTSEQVITDKLAETALSMGYDSTV